MASKNIRYLSRLLKELLPILLIILVNSMYRKAPAKDFSFSPLSFSTSPIDEDTLKVIKKDTLIKSKDAVRAEINYKAKDSISLDFQSKTIDLYSESELISEDMTLKSGLIKINWDSNIVHARPKSDSLGKITESPVFIDGDQEFKASAMDYNFSSKKAKIFNLITKEGENYIHGEVVKRDSQNIILAKNAKYTTCDQGHPHFYISATKIKIMKDQIISGPAFMVIEDIPVPVAVPFGFFPKKTERSSGIIFPAYGESPNRGFFLKGGGYYFGINDYIDLAIKGDIYSRGSWLADFNTNYVKRYKYRGNLNITYAHNRFGDPEATDFILSKDFNIRWTHSQDAKARPYSSFHADVNAGSANSYRNNSINPNDILQNTLMSGITYNKTFPRTPISFAARLSHSQNLSNHSLNLSLPDASFNISRVTPFKPKKGIIKKKWYTDLGFRYSLNFRNSIETYDTLIFKESAWENWRNGFRQEIPFSTSMKVLKYFTFSPSFSYTGRTYFSRKEKIYLTATDSLTEQTHRGFFMLNEYNVSGNLSTRIYGLLRINKMGIIAVRHQLTPSVSFVYRPDFSDPKYKYFDEVQIDSTGRTQRYSYYATGIWGYPGSGRQGSITFNIQNNLEAKIKSKNDTANKGVKKVKLLDYFNLGGYYNFLADSFNLSNINFQGRAGILKNKIGIQFTGEFDPYAHNSLGKRYGEFAWSTTGNPGRISRANVSVNGGLSSGSAHKKKEKNRSQENIYGYYVDFDVPWSLSFNYNLNYSKPLLEEIITQSIGVNGNVNLTENWRIDFSTGYDLKARDFTLSSINVYRDLHCWEMSLSLNPFGTYKYYLFRINVKSSTLKDLKLEKTKHFYDY